MMGIAAYNRGSKIARREADAAIERHALAQRYATGRFYCSRCGSRLYPVDAEPMQSAGVCSYCINRKVASEAEDLLARNRESC